MVATFVIFLREGIEASMIVAILLAYLDRMGKREYFRDVLAGVAAALLTYMTFWMRDHAQGLSDELRARTDVALDGGARWGLALLAFQAVGREGVETMVFTLAIVFATSAHGVLIGAIAGLVVSLFIANAMYRLGKRINIGLFFKVVGALLMVFAAGILVDAVENLQELGWVPWLTHPMWSTAHTLSENSAMGDVFHAFFGYADHPTVLQLICYFTYLALAVSAFLWVGRNSRFGGRRVRATEAGQVKSARTPAPV